MNKKIGQKEVEDMEPDVYQIRYKDRDGKDITEAKYGELIMNPRYQELALDEVENYRVFTYWLGQLSTPEGALFETIIDPKPDCIPMAIPRYHYHSKEAALMKHQEIVQHLKNLNEIR